MYGPQDPNDSYTVQQSAVDQKTIAAAPVYYDNEMLTPVQPQPAPAEKRRYPKWVRPVMIGLIVLILLEMIAALLLYTHTICIHKWQDATCQAPRTCSRCGKTEGGPASHRWLPATCSAPATCEVCGETSGACLPHTWQAADCTQPKTCAVCGMTEGTALGHQWSAADCETPRFCKICRASDGEPLGHDWADADCTHPRTCRRCGKTEGSPLEHQWLAATPKSPETCSVCGVKRGAALAVTLYGNGYVQTRTGSPLNLRETASTDGKVVATIPQHTNLDLYYFGRDDWYFVYYKTYSGYVSASYIQLGYYEEAAGHDEFMYGYVKTKGGKLNLRASTSTNSKSLAMIPNGTDLVLYWRDGDWYYTEYNGEYGFVSAKYIVLY
ncbi:MAG: SH3 domain-containing protein [Oscillospiraceae bacterium]|nr:SH3 domain-containing protein [Oscillospiraceae bacterium]